MFRWIDLTGIAAGRFGANDCNNPFYLYALRNVLSSAAGQVLVPRSVCTIQTSVAQAKDRIEKCRAAELRFQKFLF